MWQCVEFARRWLIMARGYTFDSVDYAWQIFDLPWAVRVSDKAHVPFVAIPNGGNRVPAMGSIIIWNAGGYYPTTGHVGIIVEVGDTYVRVAEQNFADFPWPAGLPWSRQLPLTRHTKGGFTIQDTVQVQMLLSSLVLPVVCCESRYVGTSILGLSSVLFF